MKDIIQKSLTSLEESSQNNQFLVLIKTNCGKPVPCLVARDAVGAQVEPAQDVQAVVHRHEDHVPVRDVSIPHPDSAPDLYFWNCYNFGDSDPESGSRSILLQGPSSGQ